MLERLLKWIRCRFCLKQKHENYQKYFFLRIAKANRWQRDEETNNSPTAQDAVKDLKLQLGENGLSLYKLQQESEADELACVYSIVLRDNPQHFEYVLFPASVLSDYRVDHVPVIEHPRFLSERHYEIPKPSEEQLLHLAEHILASPSKKVARIMKQQIVDYAVQHGLLETEDFRNRVGERWRKLIEQKIDKS